MTQFQYQFRNTKGKLGPKRTKAWISVDKFCPGDGQSYPVHQRFASYQEAEIAKAEMILDGRFHGISIFEVWTPERVAQGVS